MFIYIYICSSEASDSCLSGWCSRQSLERIIFYDACAEVQDLSGLVMSVRSCSADRSKVFVGSSDQLLSREPVKLSTFSVLICIKEECNSPSFNRKSRVTSACTANFSVPNPSVFQKSDNRLPVQVRARVNPPDGLQNFHGN